MSRNIGSANVVFEMIRRIYNSGGFFDFRMMGVFETMVKAFVVEDNSDGTRLDNAG